MDSEDGQRFVKNLAHFVRTHERALANALQLQRQRPKNGRDSTAASSSTNSTSSSMPFSLAEALKRPYLSLSSRSIKPAKLTLTPHHLFYLLSKFEDLGVDVGPMTVRLENLHSNVGPSNYVSFLGQAPKSKGKQADTDSLRSVSSVRSVMSSVSSVWSAMTMSNNAAKIEKEVTQYRDDIKYLYSCFTKIPALRLSPDHRARLISGFEEFPFDTAVPLFAFKNLGSLEICDLDFRQFHGWDRLSEQLRSLTVKRAGVDDPIDLLQNVILDDAEKRRKRSSKTQVPTTPSTPGIPWPSGSPRFKHAELARSTSAPNSPLLDQRRRSTGSPFITSRTGTSDGKASPAVHRSSSRSPPPPTTPSKHGSLRKARGSRSGTPVVRRSSGSSGSSTYSTNPRHSSTDLLSIGILPSSKWMFLRHLSLAENGLTHVTVSSLIPVVNSLQSLDLSGNLFSEIPDALASLTHLRALNLSNCMIDSLQSLSRSPLPAITTLNLRSNRLLSLAGIERLYSLERIDLRDNRLHDPTEMARLTGIPDIVDLYVLKNPFTRTHSNYRVTIFNLFRSSPGHVDDVNIDCFGPTYSEKKHLVDRVAEPPNKPVVKPPLEDEDAPPSTPQQSVVNATLARLEDPPILLGHARSKSDSGLGSTPRRKKAPRRRIVDLAQSEQKPTLPQDFPMEPSMPVPELTEIPPTPYTPTTESDQPTTPEATPYHTAPSHPPLKSPLTLRPRLDAGFTSPTPAPKIRNPSDDDADDEDDHREDAAGVKSDTYRRKVEALKQELGPNWLSALGGDRMAEQRTRDRSFSPASRSSTIRPDRPAPSVSVSGRTLG